MLRGISKREALSLLFAFIFGLNGRHAWVTKFSFQPCIPVGRKFSWKKSTLNLGWKWKSTPNEAKMVILNCISYYSNYLIGLFKELDPFCTSVVGVTHIFRVYLTYIASEQVRRREEYKKGKQTRLKSKQWSALKWPSVLAHNDTLVWVRSRTERMECWVGVAV